jgi:hypothetical protein
MLNLIDQLFPESSSSIIFLLSDFESKEDVREIEKSIGRKILESGKILTNPNEQIRFITSLANFSNSIEECHNVANIVLWGIYEQDIFPMITKHYGKDLAYRSLISISFFEKVMVKRTNRYGAPCVDYYKKMGQREFCRINMEEIANHFDSWTLFLREMLIS